MNQPERPVWIHAVKLIAEYLRHPQKTDDLLIQIPENLDHKSQRRCRFLVLGFIKNKLRLESSLNRLVKREPSTRLKSIIFIAGAEMLNVDPAHRPKIVHYAVNFTKKTCSVSEAHFINAILRKLPIFLDDDGEESRSNVEGFSWKYSHPLWLVERWIKQFGQMPTENLLKWNQGRVQNYIYFFAPEEDQIQTFLNQSKSIRTTQWTGFFSFQGSISPSMKRFLESGIAVIMDPASRLPVALLDVQPDEAVADLCAAPGGKSRQIIHALGGHLWQKGKGRLLAMDLQTHRIDRLHENLHPWKDGDLTIRCCDLGDFTRDRLKEEGLYQAFDAVLLDVPCSNTGVMRRRPDVRYRLKGNTDIIEMALLQASLLKVASDFVKPGGRMVYSTCSIEQEENEGVIANFLESGGLGDSFKLKRKKLSYPWIVQHDGGAAFLLERNK